MVPVVVINNGFFEAAGIAFSEEEFKCFTGPNDYRPKTILFIPKTEAIKQCPRVEKMLN